MNCRVWRIISKIRDNLKDRDKIKDKDNLKDKDKEIRKETDKTD